MGAIISISENNGEQWILPEDRMCEEGHCHVGTY